MPDFRFFPTLRSNEGAGPLALQDKADWLAELVDEGSLSPEEAARLLEDGESGKVKVIWV